MSTTNSNDPGMVAPGNAAGFAADASIPAQLTPGQPAWPGQSGFAPAGYAQPGYAQPIYAGPDGPGRQGPAITSLVLGIVAAVFCLIPIVGMISLLLAPIGFVFGAIAWRGASTGRRAGKGKAIAGVVLAVVSFLGAIASTVALATAVDEASQDLDRAFGNATEQVLAQDLGVAFGSYSAEDAGFGVLDGSLSATLTNTSDKAQSFDVKVEALTPAGKRIATDTAYVSDLGAGQSDEVELFEFVSAKDAAQLEDATFRVIAASAY